MRFDKEVFVIVHNVRSLHNVGSLFRTADAAGTTKIYLTGYTPSPLDEFGRPRKEIQKTALGAEKYIPWEKRKDISRLIENLKEKRIAVIALENIARAKDYRRIVPKKSFALIIGNEVRGLSKTVLKKADAIIKIPMRGGKESLNVSTAFGIAIYKLLENRG